MTSWWRWRHSEKKEVLTATDTFTGSFRGSLGISLQSTFLILSQTVSGTSGSRLSAAGTRLILGQLVLVLVSISGVFG